MNGTAPEARRGQLLAAWTAFLTLFAIVGFALYGLPSFYPFFVTDLGWTREQVTRGNMLSKVAVGLGVGFLAGVLIDRFGPKRLMIVGILLAGIAVVGLSHSTTLSAFYFFYMFNALGYAFGGPLPNQVMLSGWFDKARGKAMGFAYLGIGIGGALVNEMAPPLIAHLGWRGALQAIGILMILIALPCAVLVREPLRAAASAAAPAMPLSDVLRRLPFYLLAIGSMASIGAIGGTMQSLPLYLKLDRQITTAQIGRTMFIILIGSTVGRVLMGFLADRWPKKRVMLLIYSIVAGAIPLMVFAPSLTLLRVFAFLFGIGLGGDYMIIPLIAAELFGLAGLGRVLGIVLSADSIAEALVPNRIGALRDALGSYETPFLLLTGLAAVGAIAVSALPSPPRAPRSRSDHAG
jgi:MFS family permease